MPSAGHEKSEHADPHWVGKNEEERKARKLSPYALSNRRRVSRCAKYSCNIQGVAFCALRRLTEVVVLLAMIHFQRTATLH